MNVLVKNVDMTYNTGKKALQNVSIEMNSPNLIGLLGPNGAGKSTLMKLMVGGLLPTKGELFLDKVPLIKNEKKLRASLGYLPQSFGLYEELTVFQFLNYMSALKEMRDSRKAIDEVVKMTNLLEKRNAKISTLSGGQRQRVGIAQAILGNPELLIFDEPTVGLDPEERINFRNLFSKMAEDKIVLLSTHIIEDVQSVCNRLIVINLGKILFDGTPAELIKLAQGHVGVFENQPGGMEDHKFQITARVNTVSGVSCRVVAQKLPSFCHIIEPSLEDAYMYLIGKEEMTL